MKRPVRILLVDDDLKTSSLLRRFIEAEGYRVDYAPDGPSALDIWRQTRPDLILLDINMPGPDGFEIAQTIRRADKRVIIFFLTDRTGKSDRLRGFSLRGNDYIPKPFYPEELIARIRERIGSFTDDDTGGDTEYQLGDTIFRPGLCTLTHRGQTRQLSVRQAEILQMLARQTGRLIERDTILSSIWGDTSYANSLALNVQITYLRRLLAPDPTLAIVAIKTRGYLLRIDRL